MMLKKLLGTILCILVMVLGVICYMEFKSPASGERIDNYLLSAGNGTYCGGTKTPAFRKCFLLPMISRKTAII